MRIEKADEGRGWKDGRKEGESREVARSQISGNPDTQRQRRRFLKEMQQVRIVRPKSAQEIALFVEKTGFTQPFYPIKWNGAARHA